jgi:hypothetical protein
MKCFQTHENLCELSILTFLLFVGVVTFEGESDIVITCSLEEWGRLGAMMTMRDLASSISTLLSHIHSKKNFFTGPGRAGQPKTRGPDRPIF